MPLTGTEMMLAKQIETQITAALAKRGNAQIDPKSISGLAEGIAMAIVPHLLTNAQVAPGIPTAGSPTAQATVAPGTLM
jgi:hypothetical protein